MDPIKITVTDKNEPSGMDSLCREKWVLNKNLKLMEDYVIDEKENALPSDLKKPKSLSSDNREISGYNYNPCTVVENQLVSDHLVNSDEILNTEQNLNDFSIGDFQTLNVIEDADMNIFYNREPCNTPTDAKQNNNFPSKPDKDVGSPGKKYAACNELPDSSLSNKENSRPNIHILSNVKIKMADINNLVSVENIQFSNLISPSDEKFQPDSQDEVSIHYIIY